MRIKAAVTKPEQMPLMKISSLTWVQGSGLGFVAQASGFDG
jgi:hypothetical protein